MTEVYTFTQRLRKLPITRTADTPRSIRPLEEKSMVGLGRRESGYVRAIRMASGVTRFGMYMVHTYCGNTPSGAPKEAHPTQ